MSQPNTTSQKPKPPSTAEKNLSRWMYLPRRMPSMSETATFTLPSGDLRIASRMPAVSFFALAVFLRAAFFICLRRWSGLNHGGHGEHGGKSFDGPCSNDDR